MSNEKQLKKDAIEGGCDDCGISSTNTSRRKFAKGAFGAPVIASLMSTPAWGWGGACSISGLRSTNLSGHNHGECNGNGCTPGFWKTNLAAWSCTGYSPGVCKKYSNGGKCKEWDTSSGATFLDAFGFEFPLPQPIQANYTLLDVMLDHHNWGSHGTYYNHLVAALLNASCSPWAYGATAQQVIDLGNDVYNGVIDWQEAKAVLVNMNEAGNCFLNAHGDCQTGYTRHVIAPGDTTCIPACPTGYHFDLNTGQCVPDTP